MGQNFAGDLSGGPTFKIRIPLPNAARAQAYQRATEGYTFGMVWSVQAADALRLAIHAYNLFRRDGIRLDPDMIAAARKKYEQAVACGISINISRPWPKGNHPGLVLARRLQRKADQVWLFTTRTDVPPTNNGSEAAIRGFKLAEKVSGCWRTLTTLQRHCRIRSYLVTAANHARRPLDAITDVLNATPWMPPGTTTPTTAQAA